jgi:acetyl-CoA C-acetyltransferase
MLAPAASHQAHLGALIADYGGLEGIEASTIEAGGASGGAALRMGYLAVKSGEAKVALILGVEKVTDQLGPGTDPQCSSCFADAPLYAPIQCIP